MKIVQNRTEKILTTLLKMALHDKPSDDISWDTVSEMEWKACYDLAVKHGVMAIAFDGLMMLAPAHQPSRPLKLSWALAVRKYEERYERYCQTASELSSYYSDNGISMVQMKGVGLSSYYPVPAHREGGDIDIYTYSSDRSKLSDSEANQLADKLMEDQGIIVRKEHSKHSNFFYRNISIENHKTFINVGDISIAGSMNEVLHELLKPRKISLCDGRYTIAVPSPEFNALFLAFHAGQHFCSGLRLHHIFDYACMLKNYGLPLSDKVTDRKLLRFIYALTSICNELLGTDMTVPDNEKMVNHVYQQIMHPRFSDNAPKNKIGIFIYKTAKLLYIHKQKSMIFRRSLFREIKHSIIFHIKNPETIFTVVSK